MGVAHSHDGSSTEFGTATGNNTCTISEIEEENPNEPSETWYGTPTQVEGVMDDNVYVAVGMNSSSVDALVWTLKNIVMPSTVVYLVHVFPAVHRIPTPLGMLPRSQVAPALVESYLRQEGEHKLAMLQKFLNLCDAFKVKVDTVLVESNFTEKAILRLISVENIRKLVLGTNKSNISATEKWMDSADKTYTSLWPLKAPARSQLETAGVGAQSAIRKRRAKAIRIQRKNPDCIVKLICEGKEVTLDEECGPFCCRCFSSMFT